MKVRTRIIVYERVSLKNEIQIFLPFRISENAIIANFHRDTKCKLQATNWSFYNLFVRGFVDINCGYTVDTNVM